MDGTQGRHLHAKPLPVCITVTFVLAAIAGVVWQGVEVSRYYSDPTDFKCFAPKQGLVKQSEMHQVDVFKGPGSFSKGINLDDTTLQNCPERMLRTWPNTIVSDDQKMPVEIKNMRIVRTWDYQQWNPDTRKAAWKAIVTYVHMNHMKVLVGTTVTCSPEDDARDWNYTKRLIQDLGREHILGVAVGNELELLWSKDFDEPDKMTSCLRDLWDEFGYLQRIRTVKEDLEKLGPAWADVTLTTVIGGSGFEYSNRQFDEVSCTKTGPCTDKSKGGVYKKVKLVTLFKDVAQLLGDDFQKRWVYSVNFYPYWDPVDQCKGKTGPDAERCCTNKLNEPNFNTFVSGNNKGFLPEQFKLAKDAIINLKLTGDAERLWIGETGWSSPAAHGGEGICRYTENYVSMAAFENYYTSFLKWDMAQGDKSIMPEIVFYFANRDSSQFGHNEYFGLVPGCDEALCKIQDTSLTTTLPSQLEL